MTWIGTGGLFAIASILLFLRRQRANPSAFFPTLSLWKRTKPNWKERFVYLPEGLFTLALLLLMIAWLNPTTEKIVTRTAQVGPPKEGVLLFLVLDQSGSMRTDTGHGTTRMDKLKEVTTQFLIGDAGEGLQGRSNDLVGMLAFARVPTLLSPPTLDHETLLEQIQHLYPVRNSEQDGTAIGYAIFRASQWLASTKHFSQEMQPNENGGYQIRDMAIIVVTDGLQNPHPQDSNHAERAMSLDQAALYAKEQGIRLYIINIEPQISHARFAPERRQMERVTVLTGGKFYFVNEQETLPEIFAAIDQLEKSHLGSSQPPQILRYKQSLAADWIASGWLALTAAYLLQLTWLRRFP